MVSTTMVLAAFRALCRTCAPGVDVKTELYPLAATSPFRACVGREGAGFRILAGVDGNSQALFWDLCHELGHVVCDERPVDWTAEQLKERRQMLRGDIVPIQPVMQLFRALASLPRERRANEFGGALFGKVWPVLVILGSQLERLAIQTGG